MKIRDIIYILLIPAVVLGLILVSNHYKNLKINSEETDRKEKNALQVIIDSTKNKNPVFNTSLKGKIIVVNIWKPGEPVSTGQIPELNKLVNDFKSDKVVFVAIALDFEDSAKAINDWKKSNTKFDYQLLFGQSRLAMLFNSFKLRNEFFEKSIPTNIVINPEGKIELFYVGAHPGDIENIRNYLAAASGKM